MGEKATKKHTFKKGRVAEVGISQIIQGRVKIPVPDDIEEEAEFIGYLFQELDPEDYVRSIIEESLDTEAHFVEDYLEPVNFSFDGDDYSYEEDY